MQILGFARRREALEIRRITLEVRRPVASQLVHHDEQIAVGIASDSFHSLQEDLVQALPFRAQLVDIVVIELLSRQPFADSLAA